MQNKLRLVGVALLLLCANKVSAATYYVSPSGNDSNSCATAQSTVQANQKLTVSAAISCATPANGDIVYIHGGNYFGATNNIDAQRYTVPSGTSWGNALTISGYPGETVTINPASGDGGIRLSDSGPSAAAHYIIIQDLHFNKGNGAGEGIYIYTAHHIRMQRIELYGGTGSNNFGVHAAQFSDYIELLDSKIHDIGDSTGGLTDGHCIYWTASNSLILRNEVYNCGGYGIHLYGDDLVGNHNYPSTDLIEGNYVHDVGKHGGTAYGIVVSWGSDDIVRNNLVINNPGGISLYSYSTRILAYNNTVYNNKPYEGIMSQYYTTPPTISQNIVYNNGSYDIHDYGGSGGGHILSNNVTIDPHFTNIGTLDFTVTGSPAQDIASCISGVSIDYRGTSRPQNGFCDAGAFETVVGGATPTFTTYYVSPSGSDSNSCTTATSTTVANQKLTIQAGVSCLTPSDTLLIHAGTYTGASNTINSASYTVPSGTNWSLPINIRAVTGETVTITPPSGTDGIHLTNSNHHIDFRNLIIDMATSSTGLAVYLDTSHDLRFTNVEMKNGSSDHFTVTINSYNMELYNSLIHGSSAGNGINNSGNNNYYGGNTVYSNGAGGFYLYNSSGPHTSPSDNVIARNKIYSNGVDGVLIAWGTNNAAFNNVVYLNGDVGIHAYTGSVDTGIFNNTIYNNSGEGLAMQYYSAGLVVENNIVTSNVGGNIVDHGGGSGTVISDHNLTTNPGFVNVGTYNFALASSAVTAINQGVYVGVVTNDFIGTVRPQGITFDIGAYEFTLMAQTSRYSLLLGRVK